MTRHIGILGCSTEGASLCHRTISAEGARLMGPHAHPEISLHSFSLAQYTAHLDAGDLRGVADLMSRSAKKLAASGADFWVCPDNTIHQALPFVDSPLPYLHIAEVVAQEAAARGFRRLGITGTRWLVESDVYPDKLGALEWRRPDQSDREAIHHIIMNELVYGIFTAEAVQSFQRIIEKMKKDGCDAVILGCTEIPLLMKDDNSPLPTLDSTRLLARAALRHALGM